MEHAKLSASGSSRWLRCPGSIAEENKYEDSTPSTYAIDGTLAHALSERCLLENSDATYYIDKDIEFDYNRQKIRSNVTNEIANGVQQYIEYVRSLETIDSNTYIEKRVDLSEVIDNGFGTADCIIEDKNDLHIIDLKSGFNIINAKDNSQLMLYGIGFLKGNKHASKITVHIVQPNSIPKNFDSYSYSYDELMVFKEEVKYKAKLALSENAPIVAGIHCKWCKAEGNCTAQMKLAEEIIGSQFDSLDGIDEKYNNSLCDEDIKNILDNKSFVENFLKAVYKNSSEKLQQGQKVKGYKLIKGKSNRKWNSKAESVLSEELKEKAYIKSLITITAVEKLKLLDKDTIKELTFKPEGSLKMVKESAKGEAIVPISDYFDII